MTFVWIEDSVQALSAKSFYFPPSSLVITTYNWTQIIHKPDNLLMDNWEYNVTTHQALTQKQL
jgi:hypothetical protein